MPFSARQPIRYSTASMMPQARLQPERADEHRADFGPARLGDAERAGEREHHDQPEEHLGDALVGSRTRLVDLTGSSGMRLRIWW